MSVSASVFDFCAEVKVTQEYSHPSSDPLAAPLDLEYKFPLGESDSAVVGFEATIGERVLKGIVQEKAAALAAFNKARSAGHQALLLQNDAPAAPAEFSLKIGLLKGAQKLKIVITYVATLALEGRTATRLVLPSAIAPKYRPNQYAGWQPPRGVAAAMGDAQEQGMDFMVSGRRHAGNQRAGHGRLQPLIRSRMASYPSMLLVVSLFSEANDGRSDGSVPRLLLLEQCSRAASGPASVAGHLRHGDGARHNHLRDLPQSPSGDRVLH